MLPPMLKMLGLTEETVGEFQSLMKVMLSLPARLDRIERRIDELTVNVNHAAEAMAPRYVFPDGEGKAGENVCEDELQLRLATLESTAHQHGLGSGLP